MRPRVHALFLAMPDAVRQKIASRMTARAAES
jgi:hypothetical protein